MVKVIWFVLYATGSSDFSCRHWYHSRSSFSCNFIITVAWPYELNNRFACYIVHSVVFYIMILLLQYLAIQKDYSNCYKPKPLEHDQFAWSTVYVHMVKSCLPYQPVSYWGTTYPCLWLFSKVTAQPIQVRTTHINNASSQSQLIMQVLVCACVNVGHGIV